MGLSNHFCDTRESPLQKGGNGLEALFVVSQKWSFPTALLHFKLCEKTGRSPRSGLLPTFLVGRFGSPTRIDYRKKKLVLILTSLLEDLQTVWTLLWPFHSGSEPYPHRVTRACQPVQIGGLGKCRF